MIRKMHELKVLMKDDPKRAGVLCLLAGVLVIVGVRAAFFTGGPKKASASSKGDALASSSSEAVRAGANAAAAVVEKSRGEIVVLPEAPTTLRDVFQIDQSIFPLPVVEKTAGKQGEVAPKSAPVIAETPEEAARKARIELELRVEKEASGLRLRGTLMGSNPTAVIETASDRKSFVLTPGQEIVGFTLVEVTSSSVTLEKEGITVEVQRATPESR
jgi:hypothetical protein